MGNGLAYEPEQLMNYDPIARFYDPLSRLVFGRAQVQAQIDLLKHLPSGGKILIAGGGTGWILEEIAKLYNDLSIDYVELSEQMLSIARQKNIGKNSISFYKQAVEAFAANEGSYNAVLTFFLFDNFGATHAEAVFTHINSLLKSGGIWLYADFVAENSQLAFWQKILFRLMYGFFRFLCKVEAKRMMDMQPLFAENYTVKEARKYYRGFVVGKAFVKRDLLR